MICIDEIQADVDKESNQSHDEPQTPNFRKKLKVHDNSNNIHEYVSDLSPQNVELNEVRVEICEDLCFSPERKAGTVVNSVIQRS